MSIDGYIAGAASRLLLSHGDDFDRVDDVRASCDAILVGAATVRIDNPRLLVRSELRRERRAARGLPPSPAKVTVTRRAHLDAEADFFTAGDTETRAWTLHRGESALDAAGEIHTDIARGFIRCEVIRWDELVDAGTRAEARRRGLERVEGKTYVVADGDVLNVRFNV